MKKKAHAKSETAELHRQAEGRRKSRQGKPPAPLTDVDTQHILRELQRHQNELEIQNEELRRIRVELEASQGRYCDLFDLAPVGYVLLSEKGLILEANLTAATQLGVARDALVKQPLTRFILPEDQDIFCQQSKQLFEAGAPQGCELRLLRANAQPFWTRLEASVVQDADGAPMCRAVLNDITEYRHAEKLQDAIYRIAQAADQAESLNSLYPSIHAIIQEVMVADNFYIALYDEKNDLLSFPYSVDEADPPAVPKKPGKGLTEYVLRTGKSVLCDEALYEELIQRAEIELVGAHSPIWLGVPLIVEGRTIGVMAVQDYKNARAYGEHELRILEFVSSQVAITIHRKRAEETQAIRTRIASIFSTLPDEEMFNEVLKVILEVMHSPFGVFGYLDENGDWVAPTMIRKIWDTCKVPEKKIRFPQETWGDSSWPRALREKRAIYSNEPSTNIPEGHVSIQRHISMPILIQGEAIGLFQVANKETDYTEADIRTMAYIAETVAPLLSARLRREQAEEALRLERDFADGMIEVAQTIVLVLDSQGRIVRFNPYMEEISGYALAEVQGKDWFGTFLPERYWEPTRNLFQNTLEDIYSRGNVSPIVTKDGREREIEWYAKTLRDGQGNVVGVVSIGQDITESKLAEEALQESEEKFRNLFNNAQVGMFRTRRDGSEILDMNERFLTIFGSTRAELQVSTSTIHWADPHEREEMVRRLEAEDHVTDFECRMLNKKGEVKRCLMSLRLYKEQGILEGSILDITERKQNELIQNAIYRITQTAIASDGINALYHSIHSILGELIPAENFFIALYDAANGLISFPYYMDQYDKPPSAPIQIQGLTGYVIRTGRPLLATREVFNKLVQQGEVEVVGTMSVDWLGVPLKVKGSMIGVMAVQSYTQGIHYNQPDIDLLEFVSTQVAQAIERKRLEEEIRSLSLTDELTGLYNRRGFTLLAEQEVKLAQRIKKVMLLFFGDVDDLKTINDTLGHAQGDLALKEVSAILKESFRESDILARIGGDEFVALALDASKESGEIITNRIQATLEARNQPGDETYHLSLSMGIARYDPEAPCTLSELIAQADGLMYQQKQARKGKK